MGRPIRILFKNGRCHVTAWGIDRQSIFRHALDRQLVGEMVGRHAIQVHAYVLMDNHYHLLMRTPPANLSVAAQRLNVAYSFWWNRRQGRVGLVFQGRFKAVVVESGEWVLACSLHIELNPVAVATLDLGKEQKRAEAHGWQRAPEPARPERVERLRTFPWS